MTMRCRVCGQALENGACAVCGFDEGLNWESYPTLAPEAPPLSLARRRERWSETEGEALRCAQCGGISFSIFPGKGKARCCTCGSYSALNLQKPADVPKTGTSAARAPGASGTGGWRCSCGFLNSDGARTCSNCGQTRRTAPASKPAPRNGDDSWICTCGTRNSGSHRYCSVCDRPRRVKTIPRPGEDTWICPCGTRNSSSTRFCTACDRPRR